MPTRQAGGRPACRTGRQGFTLIEMLVVVAIIGILSSVLLTGLGPARDKAKDSRILTEVNQARAIATSMDNGGYKSLPETGCAGDGDVNQGAYPDLYALVRDIESQGGKLYILKSKPGGDELYRAFVIYSQLNVKVGGTQNQATNFFCVDSRGRTGYFPDLDLCGVTDASAVACPLLP